MRLFVAVGLPGEVQERLGRLAGELPPDGLKKVAPGNMHVTLKFLGEAGEGDLEWIRGELEKVKFSEFGVKIEGVGVFPNENYVRVVWAGTESGRKLEELARKVEDALSPRFPAEKRGFSSHVTLARVRRKIEVRGFLGKHKGEELGEFGVEKFALMRSVLGREGPEYSVVAEFPAEGNAPGEGE